MPRPGQLMDPAADGLSDRIAIGLLTRTFPPHLVDRMVAECGRVERRSRLLPARTVVYFVLAMCLFSQASYAQVARLLTDGLAWAAQDAGPRPVPSTAAISRARARLGAEPVAALFTETARAAGAGAWPEHYGRWRLVTVDGITVTVPDSTQNRALYGRPPVITPERLAPPQVDLVVLAECGSHAITRAALGNPLTRHALVRQLFGTLARGDLLLADRGFADLELLPAARKSGADLLWRLGPCALPPVRINLPDGSYLCDLTRHGVPGPRTNPAASTVRVIEPVHAPAKETKEKLVTTVLDHTTASSQSLAALYSRRWDIKGSLNAYGTLRSGVGPHVLRSRWPAGVEQELWGQLLVHYALRSLLR